VKKNKFLNKRRIFAEEIIFSITKIITAIAYLKFT
jgi:hypothetical protein